MRTQVLRARRRAAEAKYSTDRAAADMAKEETIDGADVARDRALRLLDDRLLAFADAVELGGGDDFDASRLDPSTGVVWWGVFTRRSSTALNFRVRSCAEMRRDFAFGGLGDHERTILARITLPLPPAAPAGASQEEETERHYARVAEGYAAASECRSPRTHLPRRSRGCRRDERTGADTMPRWCATRIAEHTRQYAGKEEEAAVARLVCSARGTATTTAARTRVRFRALPGSSRNNVVEVGTVAAFVAQATALHSEQSSLAVYRAFARRRPASLRHLYSNGLNPFDEWLQLQISRDIEIRAAQSEAKRRRKEARKAFEAETRRLEAAIAASVGGGGAPPSSIGSGRDLLDDDDGELLELLRAYHDAVLLRAHARRLVRETTRDLAHVRRLRAIPRAELLGQK